MGLMKSKEDCWSVVPLTLCPVDVPGVSESTSKSACTGIKIDILRNTPKINRQQEVLNPHLGFFPAANITL